MDRTAKIIIIAMSVLTIVGVGFGTYGMIQSHSKDKQIFELELQIKDNGEVAEEAEVAGATEVTEEGEIVATGNDVKDYIYIGAWGIKIKKPKDKTKVKSPNESARFIHKYTYRDDWPQAMDSFLIEGYSSDDNIPSVSITATGTDTPCDYFMEPSDACFDVGETRLFVNASGNLKSHFLDSSNYSRI